MLSSETIGLMKEMFEGQILKHVDGKNLGVRIHNMDYNTVTDELEMSVYYLSLEKDAKYSERDALVMKFEHFLSSFEYWQNQYTNLEITEAVWKPLTDIVKVV